MTSTPLGAVLDDLHRAEWGGLVGGLVSMTGDWAVAEDCVQDAFASALVAWRSDGVPDRPAAWLYTVARNKARDRLRRIIVEREKLRDIADLAVQVDEFPEIDETTLPDEQLRLLFTCCHPALALPNRVALTLRAVAGLTTGEIASAFFVQESTMARRLVRARQKITNAGIPYRIPTADLLPERLEGVLAVLYLLFNQGYSDASRTDLADAAIRMTRNVVRFAPSTDEARCLLSLMLLQSSRRAARRDKDGQQLTLENQDRSRWDRQSIDEALKLLAPLTPVNKRGFYRIQAEIAACHARAPSPGATDWRQIVHLYDVLVTMSPSPVVAVSRAIAVGMATGPEAALAILEDLDADPRLSTSHLLPAARADMLVRAGRHVEAATAFGFAAQRATSDLDRQQLLREAAAAMRHSVTAKLALPETDTSTRKKDDDDPRTR
ncbi:RNA polymerase sigma factor [Cryobacterium sp. N22]|uniref:RNA polymerase sigma factor n=1 Tax=Cryobacterium sp. N22 TaxID=2048290 RepID=UPI001E5D1614|nr:sigma-70 family RNA polymerase sigma factor [Cryobacterium sp. N22]